MSMTIRKPKQSKFLQLIDTFNNEVLICFNKPQTITKTNKNTTISHKWDFSLKIGLKEKISTMKSRMAEILKIKENEFIIKKYGPSAIEIKDLEAQVCSITTSDVNIFTQLGTPLKTDEILINLNFLEYDYSEFKVFPYKFVSLEKFVIHKNKKVKEIKKDIIKLIEKKTGIIIEKEEYIIIRECIQDKPAKVMIFFKIKSRSKRKYILLLFMFFQKYLQIYSDELILGEIEFIENKTILAQEYKKKILDFNSNDIQLAIRFIDFLNWKIDDPIEIHINSNTTFLQLGEMINMLYPHLKVNIIFFNIKV